MTTRDPFARVPLELQYGILELLSPRCLYRATRASKALCIAAISSVYLRKRLFYQEIDTAPAVWKFSVHEQRIQRVRTMLLEHDSFDWTAEVYLTNPIIFEKPSSPEDLFFCMFNTHQPQFRLSVQGIVAAYGVKRGPLPFSPINMFLTQPPTRTVSLRIIVGEASIQAWNLSVEDGVRVSDIVDILRTVAFPGCQLPGLSLCIYKGLCSTESMQMGMESIGSTKSARVRLCPTPSPPSLRTEERVAELRASLKEARAIRRPLTSNVITKLRSPSTRLVHSFYPPPTVVYTNVTGSCDPQ